jgi:hypothetical protein
MNPALAKKFDGKKYMWDGQTYENEEDARKTAEAYEKDGFSVQVITGSEIYLIYTRRVAAVQKSQQ